MTITSHDGTHTGCGQQQIVECMDYGLKEMRSNTSSEADDVIRLEVRLSNQVM